MQRLLSTIVLCVLAACGRRSDPPPAPAPVPAVAPAAHVEPAAPSVAKGMRSIVVPDGVSEMTLGFLQPPDVEVALANGAKHDLPAKGPIAVPVGMRLRATVAAPTPALVAWANANEVMLAVSCGGALPAELHHVSCKDVPAASALGRVQALEIAVVNELTDEAFAKLPGLPGLERLSLAFDHLTNAGLASLDRYPQLRELGLEANHLEGASGLEHVAALRELTTLDISATMLGNAEIALVTNPKLTVLSIANTEIDDGAMASVAKLVHLEVLDVSGTKVSDAGLRKLAPLSALKHLDVEDTKVTDAGCAAFNKARGGAAVCVRKPPKMVDDGPPTTTTVVGDLTLIDLSPADGPLKDQLRKYRAKKVVVETTASWCRPCIGFTKYLRDPAMLAALAGVTLVRIDFDRFAHDDLESVGIPADSVPWFVIFDDQLKIKDAISSSEWDDDVPANMAPVIGAFVKGTFKTRRHPWRP